MRFGINTLDDFDVAGKTVLCRIDINQPVDKKTNTLKDTTRIEACISTLKELLEKRAKLVLLAHQGSDIEYGNFYTTAPHAKVLSSLLGQDVKFIDDVCGPAARAAIQALQPGEVLLLDNVRYVSEEQTLFEMKLQLSHEEQAKTLLVQKLAPLGDIYVCDAFAASHRDQPSLCGFEQVMPSCMGRLFEEEFCVISSLMESPKRPCVFILGGAKISDAFLMLRTVLQNKVADKVLTGGLVSNILLVAKGVDIGQASRDFIAKKNFNEFIPIAAGLLEEFSDQIVLPVDFALEQDGKRAEYSLEQLPAPAGITDIGTKTAAMYVDIIMSAQTIFANGPVGVFENAATEHGTKCVWEAMGQTQGYTVLGGGDSITAANKYNVKKSISYVCTGGGALIRFLTGEELPVVKALRHAQRTFPAAK